jgi:hypothetical protein
MMARTGGAKESSLASASAPRPQRNDDAIPLDQWGLTIERHPSNACTQAPSTTTT